MIGINSVTIELETREKFLPERGIFTTSTISPITRIGIAAGEIWMLLDEQEWLDFSVMMDRLSEKRDVALMALGWLCREGHVRLSEKNRRVIAQLRARN